MPQWLLRIAQINTSCPSALAIAKVACPRTGASGRSLESRTSNVWGHLQSPGCRSVAGPATENAQNLRGFALWLCCAWRVERR
jgi:hypothetical protein